MKKCKYCQKEIDKKAKVCPHCSRDQRITNNPLWLIPIGIILTIILWCVLSSHAPLSIREKLCSVGLRHGYPYCYYYSWEKE